MFKVIILSLLLMSNVAIAQEDEHYILLRSESDLSTTLDRFETVIEEKGLTIFNIIDHKAGAEKVGQKLRPATLFIFGNPKIGTALMNCDQTMGLELPLKVLIYEDNDGSTYLRYIDPVSYLEKYNLTECEEVIKKVGAALKGLTETAAN